MENVGQILVPWMNKRSLWARCKNPWDIRTSRSEYHLDIAGIFMVYWDEDGSDLYTPLRSAILTFKSNLMLHDAVHLGFSRHKVHEYVDGSVQCYNCQRFGHLARNCRWSTRCKICLGPHRLADCTARRQPTQHLIHCARIRRQPHDVIKSRF